MNNNHIKGATILLSSGNYFDYLNPLPETVTIEDIAKGLSNNCRFGGQCPVFYSVAEHSVLMSYCVSKENSYDALMHDAAEAFIMDMPKPLKNILPDYQIVEERVEKMLSKKFNFPLHKCEEVAIFDRRMLMAEQRQLMKNRDAWSVIEGLEPANILIECWEPRLAEVKFLNRYYELVGEQNESQHRSILQSS